MTDRIQKMKKDITQATAFGVALYVVIVAYMADPYVFFNLGENVANWTGLIPVVFAILIAVAAFLVMGDVHNWIDKTFFGEREKVNAYIRKQLTDPCTSAQCSRAIQKGILNEENNALVNLFYTFIEPDDTERERSFSYFTEYFIFVNLSMISFIGAAITLGIAISSQFAGLNKILAFVVAFALLPILLNGMRCRIKRKLLYPTEAQTQRILTQDESELKKRLPSYRIYGNNVSCSKSGKCPL
jgi:hypothetical protein